jgi:hypothetical protein
MSPKQTRSSHLPDILAVLFYGWLSQQTGTTAWLLVTPAKGSLDIFLSALLVLLTLACLWAGHCAIRRMLKA